MQLRNCKRLESDHSVYLQCFSFFGFAQFFLLIFLDITLIWLSIISQTFKKQIEAISSMCQMYLLSFVSDAKKEYIVVMCLCHLICFLLCNFWGLCITLLAWSQVLKSLLISSMSENRTLTHYAISQFVYGIILDVSVA